MNTMIYIDPVVDLHTKAFVQVIIEFRISPAHVAAAVDPFLPLEEAEEQVDHSHKEFQSELATILAENQYPYTIMHLYKNSLNGVALELQGIAIQKLLSSQVIKAIYPNREMRIPKSSIM
ncbi:protease inhibitor I9 family protein [Sporosarcina gallistercoris]|uniref:Protease inhibitor I9 family protein n=1 Tax=Sporosarcina gallistercoris TaxID=2762245 RepID=A0ABR8PKX6_9BACL|nr:protease inhibitor I9 family protein [Sporosarcina gallistercoris]MBD7908800.1 protease inhibitor I9 family protein [Sporosarcina gallistercoris]